MLVSVTDCRHGAGASMMKRIPPRMLPLLVTSQDFSVFFTGNPSFFWGFSETLKPGEFAKVASWLGGITRHPKKNVRQIPESPNRCSGTYHRDDAIIKTIVISIRTTDGFRTLLAKTRSKSRLIKNHPIMISHLLFVCLRQENVANIEL